MLKNNVLIFSLIVFCLIGLYLIGGQFFIFGLSALFLVSVILIAFSIGAKWAHKTMLDGAEIAIKSTSSNDQYDAIKMKAIADLASTVMRIKQTDLPQLNGHQPIVPLLEGDFRIEGLEDED